MARQPRLCLPGISQHIIQRGNNRQACFVREDDCAAYASWLAEYSNKYQVHIHAWVFMTNHVHLLATPMTEDGIPRMMQSLGRHYVRYFNYTCQRTGTLWEGRYRSCVVDAEQYLLVCQRYIELNPVRAGIVESPEDYTWSSYQANGLGKAISFWKPHSVYLALAPNTQERLTAYRALFRGRLQDSELDIIRQATNKGLAIGNDRFRQDVEKLSGRRVTEMKRGPKSR